MSNASNSAAKTVLSAWLLAGTLDISAASIQTYIMGGQPVKMLRTIARAAFGEAANTGPFMPVMGLIFHYLIAFIFTILFFFLYPRLRILQKNKIVVGLLYGVFAWIVMNLAVVPASHLARFPSKPGLALIGMAILMVCIGLPISIIIHNYYSKKDK